MDLIPEAHQAAVELLAMVDLPVSVLNVFSKELFVNTYNFHLRIAVNRISCQTRAMRNTDGTLGAVTFDTFGFDSDSDWLKVAAIINLLTIADYSDFGLKAAEDCGYDRPSTSKIECMNGGSGALPKSALLRALLPRIDHNIVIIDLT